MCEDCAQRDCKKCYFHDTAWMCDRCEKGFCHSCKIKVKIRIPTVGWLEKLQYGNEREGEAIACPFCGQNDKVWYTEE